MKEKISCPYCEGEMMPKKDLRSGYENFRDDEDAFAHYFQCRSCASTSPWRKSETAALQMLQKSRTERYQSVLLGIWIDVTNAKYKTAELNYIRKSIEDTADETLKAKIREIKEERIRRKLDA